MKAVILTIGNEVLSGQVVDTNAAWIAQQLLSIGIPVREKWSVADDIVEITTALQHACTRGDIVITTGGLGPTADDLTCEALAAFMGVPRLFHHETYDRLKQIFATLGRSPGHLTRLNVCYPKESPFCSTMPAQHRVCILNTWIGILFPCPVCLWK